MEPIDVHVLPLFVVLIVPGFIAVKVYDLLVPTERRDWSSHLMEVMSYGTINFSLWFWALDPSAEPSLRHPWAHGFATVIGLFVSPALLGVLAYGLLSSRWLGRWVGHPTPTAWDHFFNLGRDCWVVCHLKDGRIIAGLLSRGSFASSYPRRQDLYLREAWEATVRGRLIRRVPRTAGVLVSMEECRFLEFFAVGGGDEK